LVGWNAEDNGNRLVVGMLIRRKEMDWLDGKLKRMKMDGFDEILKRMTMDCLDGMMMWM